MKTLKGRARGGGRQSDLLGRGYKSPKKEVDTKREITGQCSYRERENLGIKLKKGHRVTGGTRQVSARGIRCVSPEVKRMKRRRFRLRGLETTEKGYGVSIPLTRANSALHYQGKSG